MVRKLAPVSLVLIGLLTVGVAAAAAPAFTPDDGRYRGEYTDGSDGAKLRLRVEQLRPGLHGVRLLQWSGELRCPDGDTQTVDPEMTAARVGRTFSGFVTYYSPPGKYSFTGRFTARDELKARVRVKSGKGAARCDTGPITFVAERVGP